MDKPSQVVIAEVSSDDHARLRLFFSSAEVDGEGWAQGQQKHTGLAKLLQEANFAKEIEISRELRISVPEEVETFTDYARGFVRELVRRIDEEELRGDGSTLLLNLLPFHLSTTRVDKIIAALFGPDANLSSRFTRVVVLLRNIDWLVQSRAFQVVSASATWRVDLWVADLRGYVAVSTAERKDFSVATIGRDPFLLLLKTDERTIYHSLIYGTNSFIGHFILRDSHVRTHYDLTQYIQRDNVREFMAAKLVAVVGGAKSILLIGVGLETGTISRAGLQLKASLADGIHCEFRETFDTFSVNEVIPPKWAESYDTAIVLSDIVNSGKTITPFVAELQRTANGRSVRVLSIAKMKNSPLSIAGVELQAAVEIKRNFYAPNLCALCAIKQPATKIHKAADFRSVSPEQLTPYDFWEMIYETKALKYNDTDLQGRRLLYRIDTIQITKRYAGWLTNIIRIRYSENFPDSRPDAICTVQEAPGMAFASLVARALGVSTVVPISRRDLDRVGPSGLPRDSKSPLGQRSKVLVVDDGINKGETLRKLINFCRAADVEFLGAIVLDSRLDALATERIEAMMGKRPLLALYRWHTAGVIE